MSNRTLRLYWILILTTSITLIHAQEQVYVLAAMEGQGYLRSRKNHCFVITPFHVVENSAGSLEVIGPYGIKSEAIIVKEYQIADLAVLELKGSNLKCTEWLKMTNFDLMLKTQTGGHLSFREKDGSLIPFEVKFVAVTDDYIIIKSNDRDWMLNEGMSGGTLLVNGASAGMLLNVDTETGNGNVIRKDAIMRLTAPFFETPKTQPDLSTKAKNTLASSIFNFSVLQSQFIINIPLLKMQANDKVKGIYFGYKPEKLDKYIDVQKLITESITNHYFLAINPSTENLWYQVNFLDGTRSDILSRRIQVDNELTGFEIPSFQKHAPSLFLMAHKRGFPSLFLQWELPIGTTTSLYSFDEGGFFRLEKQQVNTMINRLSLPPNTDYFKFEFELGEDQKVGPYEYRIEGIEPLMLQIIKEQFEKQWDQKMECYRISQSISEEKSAQEIANRVGRLRFKDTGPAPGILCKLQFPDRYLITVLKEILIGTDPKQLNTKISIKQDLATFFDPQSASAVNRQVLNHKLPGTGKELYIQFTFYDDTKSPVKRIPVKELF